MDRELAVRLSDHEQQPDDPTLDEVVGEIPVFDERGLPDPFARLPRGLGG